MNPRSSIPGAGRVKGEEIALLCVSSLACLARAERGPSGVSRSSSSLCCSDPGLPLPFGPLPLVTEPHRAFPSSCWPQGTLLWPPPWHHGAVVPWPSSGMDTKLFLQAFWITCSSSSVVTFLHSTGLVLQQVPGTGDVYPAHRSTLIFK